MAVGQWPLSSRGVLEAESYGVVGEGVHELQRGHLVGCVTETSSSVGIFETEIAANRRIDPNRIQAIHCTV